MVFPPKKGKPIRPESEIHRLGYRSNLSMWDRRRILALAIERYGLKRVASTIAGNTELRKMQHMGRLTFQQAIANRESDLRWLKVTYPDEWRRNPPGFELGDS